MKMNSNVNFHQTGMQPKNMIYLLVFALVQVLLVFCMVANCWAEDDIRNPSNQANKVLASVPSPTAAGDSDSRDADFSSVKFSAVMWLAGVGSGIISYLLFLYLHKKKRMGRDWLLPFVLVIFLGSAIVFLPVKIDNEFYGPWSYKCLDSEGAPKEREVDSNSSDGACWRAQIAHNALGHSIVVANYRKLFLNGEGSVLTPGELKFFAWVLLMLWSAIVYIMLLVMHSRFFTR